MSLEFFLPEESYLSLVCYLVQCLLLDLGCHLGSKSSGVTGEPAKNKKKISKYQILKRKKYHTLTSGFLVLAILEITMSSLSVVLDKTHLHFLFSSIDSINVFQASYKANNLFCLLIPTWLDNVIHEISQKSTMKGVFVSWVQIKSFYQVNKVNESEVFSELEVK